MSSLNRKETHKMRHRCPDWDYMEIESHDPEFGCCTCSCMKGRKMKQKNINQAIELIERAMTNSILNPEEMPFHIIKFTDYAKHVKIVLQEAINLLKERNGTS